MKLQLRLLVGAICLLSPAAFAEEEYICPQVLLRGNSVPAFTDNETRLVCGDAKTDDAIGDSWKEIPRSQSRFHLNVFLQTRGYFSAVFTPVGARELIVDIGETTKVTSLSGEGLPPEIDLSRRRKIVGEVLTPDLLNEIEKWATQRLQALGYGCPEVLTEASPSTGAVIIKVASGPRQKVYGIVEETVGDIREGVLGRYNAFQVGDYFNGDWVSVTERRILRSGVLQGVNFTNTCDEDGVLLKLTGNAGKPRVVTVGIGTNTEGILLLRASWKNTRIGEHASIFEVSGLASNLTQQLKTSMDWYVFESSPRSYLEPAVILKRETEENYAVFTSEGQFHYGITYDNDYLHLDFNLGPTFEYVNIYRGPGLDKTYFTSWETTIKLQTHEHEYYMKSPRTGYQLGLNTLVNTEDFYSKATVYRLNLNGDALFNFKNYTPPSLVFGIRGGFNTVISTERPGMNSKLPPTYYRFLGGSQNVRGFGRETISNNGLGYMTTAFVGNEVRFAESFLPFKIEPFVFYDLGLVGAEPWKLSGTFYHSPGAGLRWESPVGTLRLTGARGWVTDQPALNNTQFYFSFGEEF